MIKLIRHYKIILIVFLFISCDETIPPTVSNEAPWYLDRTMYLYGYPPAKHNIYLNWTGIYGDIDYNIRLDAPDFNYQTTLTQASSSGDGNAVGITIDDLNYNPGYYLMAYVNYLNAYGEGSDSTLVKTKEIDPIENIAIHVETGGYDDSLTFIHSSDIDILQWDFYHFEFDQNNANTTRPQYFNISDPESGWEKDWTPSGWWGDTGWGTNKLDYYIYTKNNVDDSFCYVIIVTDEKNFSRNSHISCSDNGYKNPDNQWTLDEEIILITNNLRKKIIIEWEEYTDPDFYQYIIWRSEDKNMPEELREKLNVVIQSNQTVYHDSEGKLTPDGKTWYYMIEIENQYGKSEFSEIKSGTTMP